MGPWSQVATVIVATPPAAPNITSPTAGSPPNEGKFLVTFTSGGHEAYKYRIVQGGNSYSSGWLSGSVTTFRIAISVDNSVACTLSLAVKDSTGLESAEDSETFTPSYTGPSKPLLDLIVTDADGSIQCNITNPVTVPANHTRIKRWVDGEAESTAIWITKKLTLANSTFVHKQVRSGIAYNFKAVAFASTGGFTPSDTETATVNITDLQIHAITKESIASDASLSVGVSIEGDTDEGIIKNQESNGHFGRTKNLTYAGASGNYTRMIYTCFIARTDIQTRERLLAIYNADTILCSRDPNGILIFGRILNFDLNEFITSARFQLEVVEGVHKEAIR
jgi:hypothetical protein